jgi:ParB/RepB/Spo0J family partition protein
MSIRTARSTPSDSQRKFKAGNNQNHQPIQTMSKGITSNMQSIPLRLIDPPARSMRLDIDQERLQHLVDSINQIGLINPLLVKRVGKRYEIVAGHRRWLALKQLRKQRVNCVVFGGDTVEAEAAKLHENINRSDVDAVSEGYYLQGLMDEHKLDQRSLAKAIGRSPSYVSDRVRLLQAPAHLRHAVQTGTLTLSTARELLRIEDVPTREQMIDQAVAFPINDTTARQWRIDANSIHDNPPPAGAGTGAPTSDHVDAVMVECALTRARVNIANTMLVRVSIDAWHELVDTMAKQE